MPFFLQQQEVTITQLSKGENILPGTEDEVSVVAEKTQGPQPRALM